MWIPIIKSMIHVTMVSAIFPIVADTTPRMNAMTALNVAAPYSYDDTDRKSSDCPRKHISSKPVCTKRIFQAGCNVLSGKIRCPLPHLRRTRPSIQTAARNTITIMSESTSVFLRFHLLFIFPHPLFDHPWVNDSVQNIRYKVSPNTNNALMIVIATVGILPQDLHWTAACPSPE